MNDTEFRYFYEVAHTLNFNQAAENLYISQPALSRSISKIEQEFDAKLFVRDKKKVQLTNAGIVLLNNYPLYQKAGEDLVRKVRNATHGLTSRIHIGIQEGHIITSELKNLLQDFNMKYENIQFELESIPYIDIFDKLKRHELDVAFSLEFPHNLYDCIDELVLNSRVSYIVAGKDHPAVKIYEEEGSLRGFDGLDLIIVKWSIVPNVTSFIFNQCNSNGFSPSNVHYAPDYLTMYNWLIMDKGFAIMDKESIFSDSNIALVPLEKKYNIKFSMFWNKNEVNPSVRNLVEHVRVYLNKRDVTNESISNNDEAPSDSKESEASDYLSEDFINSMLGFPSCQIDGNCNSCGRCNSVHSIANNE